MAWDDKILHDVRGVKRLTITSPSSGYGEAETGVGILKIMNKPTVPYGSGVLCIKAEGIRQTMCDDPQLVGSWVRAYGGYARNASKLTGRIQYLESDPPFDFKKSDWPTRGDQKVLSTVEAIAEIDARKIFRPGVPI